MSQTVTQRHRAETPRVRPLRWRRLGELMRENAALLVCSGFIVAFTAWVTTIH